MKQQKGLFKFKLLKTSEIAQIRINSVICKEPENEISKSRKNEIKCYFRIHSCSQGLYLNLGRMAEMNHFIIIHCSIGSGHVHSLNC